MGHWVTNGEPSWNNSGVVENKPSRSRDVERLIVGSVYQRNLSVCFTCKTAYFYQLIVDRNNQAIAFVDQDGGTRVSEMNIEVQ
jgi:hypothetical protein